MDAESHNDLSAYPFCEGLKILARIISEKHVRNAQSKVRLDKVVTPGNATKAGDSNNLGNKNDGQ